uniref:DNA polymerase iota n=1 Tax=Lingulaulax polyedra TaxID=160621 RepID=A0A516AG96_LINPO|nr:DNA polymerase iota [Lingulodinium polyedra]
MLQCPPGEGDRPPAVPPPPGTGPAGGDAPEAAGRPRASSTPQQHQPQTLESFFGGGPAGRRQGSAVAQGPLVRPPPRRHNVLTSQMISGEGGEASDAQRATPGACASSSGSASELLRSARCIAAIDMDCFYAQCEELRNPALRGKPVGVQQKMLVITSNYAARAFGIEKGDSIRVVKEKCPEIVICNGEDLAFYAEVSQRFFDTASRLVPRVEKLGLDEIFVDLTELVAERLAALQSRAAEATVSLGGLGFLYPVQGCPEPARDFSFPRDWPGLDEEGRCQVRLDLAAAACQEVRDAILQEVGLSSSAGISVSKLLAKLVASWRKPAKQTVFLPTSDRLAQLLPDTLPVQKIPGVGFSSTQKCHELGISSIGDFLAALEAPRTSTTAQALFARFDGSALDAMRARFLGVDEAEVKPSGPPKSCSAEDSFWQSPLQSDAQVAASLEALARKLLTKVRSDERRFGCRSLATLAVSLRHAPRAGDSESPRRERRQMHLGLARAASGQGSAAAELPANSLPSAEASAARGIAQHAFGLFRKMVPQGPFAINILNLQVQFGDAVPSSQRQLCFAPRKGPSPSKAVDATAKPPSDRGPLPPAALAEGASVCISGSSDEEALVGSGSRKPSHQLDPAVVHQPQPQPQLQHQPQPLPQPQPEPQPQPPHASSRGALAETTSAARQDLLAMGFAPSEVTEALQRSAGDLQTAVEWLLRGRGTASCGSPEQAAKRPSQTDQSGLFKRPRHDGDSPAAGSEGAIVILD